MCKIINPTQMFWVLLFSYPLIRCIKIKMQKMKCGWRRHKAFHWTRNLEPFFLRHVPSCFLTNYNSGSRKFFRPGGGGGELPRHMFGKFIMKLKEICRPPPPLTPLDPRMTNERFFFNSFAQLYGYVSTSMFRGYTKLFLYDGSHGSASSFTDTDQR